MSKQAGAGDALQKKKVLMHILGSLLTKATFTVQTY